METQDKETLVVVENVSKKFSKNLKTSLKYGASDILKSSLGLESSKELRKNEFWAVKDVSFTVKRGECIGLIGHNGAGKSTLLKVLNGLYAPDIGKITMKGKIGALIELGAGFNPILTGRENIYNNAAILGFSREEVDAKMESIIAFSEIEEFLDMPVKNYSSGMKVRLGFAVAAHLEPDILIIDEVLAVGDLGFVLKCFKKIDEILPKTAVIFVSHSMPMVSRMCNEIILMDNGKVTYQGVDVAKGIDLYYNKFSESERNIVFDDDSLEFLEIKTYNSKGEENECFHWLDDMIVEIKLKNKKNNEFPYVGLQLIDKEQRGIGFYNLKKIVHKIKINEILNIKINCKELQLSKGNYGINLIFTKEEGNTPYLRVNNAIEFKMTGMKDVWQPFLLKGDIEHIKYD